MRRGRRANQVLGDHARARQLGIILSQILRGIAQGLGGSERMGAPELATALAQASSTAYKAVMKPVEGTMLTVMREASAAADAALSDLSATLLTVLEAATRGARELVERTPMLLKTLRDAGVVDAGGQGLFLILEGMLRHARGEPIELDAEVAQPTVGVAFKDIHGPDDFGYCTNFVLRGAGMPYDEIRATLAALGQSVVVVGDEELIKAHLHLLRPGDALNYAVGFGMLDQIEITNMDLQREALRKEQENKEQRTKNKEDVEPVAPVGVVAVAPGAGFAEIFRSLNVGAVVGGGQTMNPSTEDLLEAIERLPQRDVIVLPNNSNIIMAARQSAQLSTKHVEVLPTKTVPQGIAAMLGFNYQANLPTNAQAMMAASQQIQTAEITRAVRDARVDGIEVQAGQTIGLLDGELVVAGEHEPVIDDLLGRLALNSREIVTVYYGQTVPRPDAEALAERIGARFSGVEVEVQAGGQPLYDYIISAE